MSASPSTPPLAPWYRNPAQASGRNLGEGVIHGVASYLSTATNNQQFAESIRTLLSQALVTDAPASLNRLKGRIEKFRAGVTPKRIEKLTAAINQLNAQNALPLSEVDRQTLIELQTALTQLNLTNLDQYLEKIRAGVTPKRIEKLTAAINQLNAQNALFLSEVDRQTLVGLQTALTQLNLTDLDQYLEDRQQTLIGLQTALTQQSLADLDQYLSAAEMLIDEKKGTLRQLVEFTDQALLHPQSGFLARLTNQLKDGLISDRDSVINELSLALKKTLFAHPSSKLKTCFDALAKFREGCKASLPKEQLVALWNRYDHSLEGLPHRTFCAENWAFLHQDAEAIHTWIGNQGPFPEPLRTYKIVERKYRASQGILDHATEVLMSSINPLLERIEQLPARMIAHVTGGSVPIEAPSNPGASSSPDSPEETFGQTLWNTAESILLRARDQLGSKVMQATINGLASLMHYAFQKARERLIKDGQHQYVTTKINPLLKKITDLQKEGSWEQLTKTLKRAHKVMGEQLTIFQGIRLPFNTKPVDRKSNSKRTQRTSAIPELLSQINTHRRALNKDAADKPKKVTAAMIAHETAKLKIRASAYLPIKLISEWICSLSGSDHLYASLLKIPEKTPSDEWAATFQSRFFAEIDQAEIFFLRKWIGKALYVCSAPVSNFFSTAFIENILSSIQNLKEQEDPENSKETTLIRLFRNWLAILSSAYAQAAETSPKKSKDLRQMLYDALHHPSHNHGLKPTEIYASFAKSAMDTFGPRFEWRKTACTFFTQKIPENSIFCFFNPVIQLIQVITRYALNGILFIPEWICNKILHGISKLVLSYNTLLQEKVETAINSLSHNTPIAYFLNQAILQQLQKVRNAIQENLNDKSSKKKNLSNFQSRSKKRELSDLLEYLFEVLDMSGYNTQHKLKRYLKGDRTALENLKREVESLFLPKALDTAVEILTTAMKALSPDDLLYDCLTIANSTFEKPVSLSKKEFAGLESGISEIVGQILQSSIFYALKSAFDFEGKKEKKGIDLFFNGFKKDVKTCIRRIRSNLKTENPQKATKAIEHAIKLQQSQVERLTEVDGNSDFHTETKQKLNEVSVQLTDQWKRIGESLNKLAPSHVRIDQLARSDKILESCRNHLKTLIEELCDHTSQNNRVPSALLELENLNHSIEKYEEAKHSNTLLKELKSIQKQISNTIREIRIDSQDLNILKTALDSIKNLENKQRKALWAPSDEPKEAAENFKNIIGQLSNPSERMSIIKFIPSLLDTTSTQTLQKAFQTIQGGLRELVKRKEEFLKSDLPDLQKMSRRLRRAIRNKQKLSMEKITRTEQRVEKNIHRIQHHLCELEKWVKQLHKIPILSLLPFDMHWVNDTFQHIAYDLADKKVKELLIALYQKHNYASAINQLLIFPFLEKHGKHHLH